MVNMVKMVFKRFFLSCKNTIFICHSPPSNKVSAPCLESSEVIWVVAATLAQGRGRCTAWILCLVIPAALINCATLPCSLVKP